MNWRYVHLGINPIGTGKIVAPRFNETLEAYLIQQADYYRFGAQNYVLYTAASLDQMANEIRNLQGFRQTYILLSEMNLATIANYNGWMPPDFWQWLGGKRT